MHAASEAFVRAIAASPGDDTLRLIYADWLEEHSSPHSELIRLQCRLATSDAPAVAEGALSIAVRQWCRKHEADWIGPLRKNVQRMELTRGFATISLRADTFTSEEFQLQAAKWRWDMAVLRVRLNWVSAGLIPSIRSAPHLTTFAEVTYHRGYWDTLRRNPFTQQMAWWDRAVDFQRAGNDGPQRAIELHNAAMDAWNLRRFADAVSRCQEAIFLDPDQLLSRNLLAWIFATCPDPEFQGGPAAVELAEALVAQYPECAEFLDTLAAAYARCGRFEEAVGCADRAVKQQGKVRFRRRREFYVRGEAFVDPLRVSTRFRQRQAAGLVGE